MTVPRVPVMRPGATSGRSVRTAAGLRISVDPAGALQLVRDGAVRQLAGPGEVTRAVVLDAEQTRRLLGKEASYAGGLLLLAGQRPVLAVRLLDWCPPAQLDDTARRTTSGATAVAGALGVALEPADAETSGGLAPRAVRAVEVRPHPPLAAPGRLSRVLLPLAGVLGFLAWPLGGRPAAAVLTGLSLLLAAPVVLGVARGRAEARAASLEPPTGGTAVTARPAGPVPEGVLDALLVVQPEELFLRRSGTVVRLAGPAEGGVSQVVLEPEHVRLSDAAGRDHAELETALWCGDPAARASLAEDLRIAGLTVLESPVDSVLLHDLHDLSTAHLRPSTLQSAAERGDPTVVAPYLGGVVTALATGGALATLGWSVPVGLVLLVLALGLLAVTTRTALRRRRDDRRAVRPAASARTGAQRVP